MIVKRASILVVISLLLLFSSTVTTKNNPDKRIKVFVSIPPLAYFVERIGGPLVDVEVLIGPGQSPATYNPTPQQIVRLADADMLFTVGVPFEERLLEKIKSGLSDLKVIDTRKEIELQPVSSDNNKANHNHGRLDPHIWLDPKLAAIQASTICKALTDFAPAYTVQFQRSLLQLREQLDSVDQEISVLLSPFEGKSIYVFHPSFGYFCRAYGLKQVAIEVEGKEPTAKQLTMVMELTRNKDVSTLFVQPQFSQKTALAVAENIGAKVETLDPLSRDYISNLEDMANKIAESFKASR